MECHKCEWILSVPAEKRAGIRYEDTPCATCRLEEDSSHTLEFDDERAGPGAARPEGGRDLMPVSVLADAVRLLMSLPRDALEVVRLRYGGLPYREIAEMLGKSVDAVEKRHLREIEKHPALGALFPQKVSKQRARQRHKEKG